MEGRSELALLAYAKLQLSFAAAAAVAEWERGGKGEIGNGGRRATSSVTRVSHMYYRRASRQSNRCKDRVTLHAHSL